MTDQSATVQARPRDEISEVTEYLNEPEAELFLFQDIGDTVSGSIVAARRVETEIDGKVKRDIKGNAKKHLQLLLDGNGNEIVVNVQSVNQKDALRQAMAVAQIKGLATGDYFQMTYTHDDAPIQRRGKTLSAARGYSCEITPHGS